MNPKIIFPLGAVADIRASIVADTQLSTALIAFYEALLDATPAATITRGQSMGLGITWRNHTTDFNGYPLYANPA